MSVEKCVLSNSFCEAWILLIQASGWIFDIDQRLSQKCGFSFAFFMNKMRFVFARLAPKPLPPAQDYVMSKASSMILLITSGNGADITTITSPAFKKTINPVLLSCLQQTKEQKTARIWPPRCCLYFNVIMLLKTP